MESYDFKSEAFECPEERVYGALYKGGSYTSGIDTPVIRPRLMDPALKIQGGDSTSWIFSPGSSVNQWLDRGELAFRQMAFRHVGGSNAFFFDGHVEHIKIEDFEASLLQLNRDAYKKRSI